MEEEQRWERRCRGLLCPPACHLPFASVCSLTWKLWTPHPFRNICVCGGGGGCQGRGGSAQRRHSWLSLWPLVSSVSSPSAGVGVKVQSHGWFLWPSPILGAPSHQSLPYEKRTFRVSSALALTSELGTVGKCKDRDQSLLGSLFSQLSHSSVNRKNRKVMRLVWNILSLLFYSILST